MTDRIDVLEETAASQRFFFVSVIEAAIGGGCWFEMFRLGGLRCAMGSWLEMFRLDELRCAMESWLEMFRLDELRYAMERRFETALAPLWCVALSLLRPAG